MLIGVALCLAAFLPPLIALDAGFLVSVDSYMNLQLAASEEWIGGKFAGNLGEVLIRCNNVLYIRGVQEDEALEQEGAKDTAMAV
jgi:hypothetical protein